jgi:hypothetical protein
MNTQTQDVPKLPVIARGSVVRLDAEGIRVYALTDGRCVLHRGDVLAALFGGVRPLSGVALLLIASFPVKAVTGDNVMACDVPTFMDACEMDAEERPGGPAARLLPRLRRLGTYVLIASAMRQAANQ